MYKRNNEGNEHFNSRTYKEHLSAFGQKVLSNLINLQIERHRSLCAYGEENQNKRQPQPQTPHHKKIIISYNDKSDSQQQTLEYQHNTIYTSSSNVEKCADTVTPIPTNMELIESAIDVAIPQTSSIPVITSNVLCDNLININEKTNVIDNTNAVDWNNFIDTDLLSDFNTNSNAFSVTDIPSNSAPLFTLHLDKENIGTSINFENEENVKDKRIKHTAAKHDVKTKAESNTALDKKPNFRKKKYTTAVRDWLKDIDCGNVDVRDQHFVVNNNNNAIQNSTRVITMEKVPKNNKKKKTIQAQLANKDGVMKYSKPRNKINEKPVEENIETINNINEVENKNDAIIDKRVDVNVNTNITVMKNCVKAPKKQRDDKVKEKNIKAKFIAPIKSQIHVKDITYNITIVNETNLAQCLTHLHNTETQEVVVTLVYGNGFSQLNSHHTDDSCTAEGLMFMINNYFYYFKGNDKSFINTINEIMNRKIISYDMKHVLIYLIASFDISILKLNLNIFDAKIGASLIEPDNTPENFSDLQQLLNFKAEYTIATACVLQKCAWYMTSLALCAATLHRELVERELWKLFVDVEMPVLPVIAEMEHRGVCVDLEKLKSMEGVLLKQMKAIELECHRAAGKSFQVNSAAQVRSILYDELQLDTKCNVKVRETVCKGAKSTSETMLRSLMSVHPLPRLILEYRHLHKAHATFLAGIVPHVRNGIVRPTWIQTAAATGRIACSNPNLQAIPKTAFSLVLFPQEKDHDVESVALKFRSVYTARAGCALLAADFKHVECRVFAHQAADTGLLAALASPDLFRELAAKWLNKSAASVSAEERERTKRIVYASLYGAGSRKLMEILDVSYDHALSIVSSFNRTFPAMKTFGRWVVSQCEQSGGRVRTASGRTRTFPNINSNDFATKAHAQRQAINFVVQGLAADVSKAAMCRTARRVGAPLLQIHDELLWELPQDRVASAAEIIKSTMEECGREFGITAPLPVALYSGASWGDLTEFTLDHIGNSE